MICGLGEKTLDSPSGNLRFGDDGLHHQLDQNGFAAAVGQIDQNIEGVVIITICKIVQLISDQTLAVVIFKVDNAYFTDLRHARFPP